jgi:hypothetical protein
LIALTTLVFMRSAIAHLNWIDLINISSSTFMMA